MIRQQPDDAGCGLFVVCMGLAIIVLLIWQAGGTW